jgi:hypothetical protein
VNIGTATPLEIDTRIAELCGDRDAAARDRDAAIGAAHGAAGDKGERLRGGRMRYTLTDREALDRCRAIVADGYEPQPWDRYRPDRAITKYDDATARIDAAYAAMRPFDAEYDRRPWPRFFYVPGGHIHSSLDCRTCNRDGNITDLRWWPAMSGKTEAEAVAERGPVLCTVCFPSAPTEYTRGLDKPGRCPGSGRSPRPGTERRYGMRFYGKCQTCPPDADDQIVLPGSRIRAHKPTATEPAETAVTEPAGRVADVWATVVD